MKRLVLAGVSLGVLAGCGAVTTASPARTVVPFITPASTIAPTPTPTAVLAASTPSPTAAPTAPPIAAAIAPPVAVMSRSFALLPVGGSGTFGSVTVTERNGLFIATVAAHGILNGSLHTVHIHLGSCANPYGGMHLTVLGLMAGDASNSGGLSAAIAPVYLSAGHYVIVYATSAPVRIIACANLDAI